MFAIIINNMTENETKFGDNSGSDGEVSFCWTDTSNGNKINIKLMSLQQLERAIELTWYRHLELRNEVYEMDMGPFDILDVYVSSQKTARPSLSRKQLAVLMHSNFKYHILLHNQFYQLNNLNFSKDKKIAM